MINLKEKVILITGSERGIGRTTAILCAKAGATVVVNYYFSAEEANKVLGEIKKFKGKAMAVKADISKEEEVKKMFSEIEKKFGRLDVLINNAGVMKNRPLLLTSLEDFDAIHNVNLRGTFLCMRYAAKIMIREKHGKIVNISSIMGHFGSAGYSAYSSSKAGVIGLTKSTAKELGRFGINVNAVAPGVIETSLIKDIDKSAIEKLRNSISLKRIGEPEDVANVILFLSSNLSDYMNGVIVPVDGLLTDI